MNDKQVVELYYKLKASETDDFKSPPTIKGKTNSFNYSLNDGKLTIELKQPCSSVEEAQNLVDDFLRSWEIDDAIRKGRKRIEFVFHNVKIIDPNNLNNTIIYSHGGLSLGGGSSDIKTIYPRYPSPPEFFTISPDVLKLWHYYELYLENPELLQCIVYSCLTFIEKDAADRKHAAKRYKIDYKVFDMIGNLTGENRSYRETVRKYKRNVSPRPLSLIEIEWIKAALMAIIRRVGEINTAPSLPIITMHDLPKLP